MNKKIYDDSTNYTATVIRLPIKQKVEGLDNLVKVTVFGNDCLIGKDEPEDQLYLFFPAETQLSPLFLKMNNLYREIQANIEPEKKGFFELNGRVRAIKFKGIISTGFICPLYFIREMYINGIDKDYFSQNDFKEGDEFNEYDEMEICKKYVIKNVNTPGLPGSKKEKDFNLKMSGLLIPNQFRFHEDTSHLEKNLHQFDLDHIIVITDKWHGSSCILSKVFINKKLTWYQKLLNKIGGKIPTRELAYIYSSGKPKSRLPKGIEGTWKNDGVDYYTSDIWKKALEDYKPTIEDGITLYGELVGFDANGKAIQKGYDYGCKPGPVLMSGMTCDDKVLVEPEKQYRFMIYRIIYTKSDGNKIEFSWQQIKDYCKKYELEHVKEFYFGRLIDNEHLYYHPSGDLGLFLSEIGNHLSKAYNMEQIDQHCSNKIPAEGICIRIDGRENYMTYKLKSKLFLKKETEDLDKGIVGMEEEANA